MIRKSTVKKKSIYKRRREVALRKAAAGRLQCLLITRPEDVSYLTGFGGEDSALLLARGKACLLTDGRYREWAERDCGDIEIDATGGFTPQTVLKHLKGGMRRIGIQAGYMTVSGSDALLDALGSKSRKLVPADEIIGNLRLIKDKTEIRAIRRAIAIAEKAMKQLTARGAGWFIGKTERQIAGELDYLVRLAGADGTPFETIVAAGPNGAMPHYRPGNRRVRRGEPLLVDWGALVGGYCSDLTRVYFTGKIPPKLAEIYEVVRRAQDAAIRAIGPGKTGKSADRAARSLIAASGYEKQFTHGLGHGIGRQVHEAPGVSGRTKVRFRPGMVVTVEPGIYLPGIGGVRIEDDVLVTSDGRRRLSSLPRNIEAVILR